MFDFPRFLKTHWTSDRALHRLLKQYGVAGVSAAAVYKWWIRGSIPADHLPVVLALLELERGAPVSMAEFLKT